MFFFSLFNKFGQVFLIMSKPMFFEKIISGGQTGVEQGALDAALELSFPCGGWCPKGRKSENPGQEPRQT
jgi:hypothetical protein